MLALDAALHFSASSPAFASQESAFTSMMTGSSPQIPCLGAEHVDRLNRLEVQMTHPPI